MELLRWQSFLIDWLSLDEGLAIVESWSIRSKEWANWHLDYKISHMRSKDIEHQDSGFPI
jgi:hypothetical protein